MTITMKLVAGMVVIAVVIMLIHNIALPVNVWILMEEDLHQHQLQPQLHLPMHVAPLNGLGTTIVMMTITMRLVAGMVVIAVVIMLIHNIALPVNAWILMEEDLHQLQLQPQLHLLMHVAPLNGLVTTIVMMTITMRLVAGMAVIAVVIM